MFSAAQGSAYPRQVDRSIGYQGQHSRPVPTRRRWPGPLPVTSSIRLWYIKTSPARRTADAAMLASTSPKPVVAKPVLPARTSRLKSRTAKRTGRDDLAGRDGQADHQPVMGDTHFGRRRVSLGDGQGRPAGCDQRLRGVERGDQRARGLGLAQRLIEACPLVVPGSASVIDLRGGATTPRHQGQEPGERRSGQSQFGARAGPAGQRPPHSTARPRWCDVARRASRVASASRGSAVTCATASLWGSRSSANSRPLGATRWFRQPPPATPWPPPGHPGQ